MNNLAMMFPIHHNWVEMIFNGTKDKDFRNKLPKHLKVGMKIYFYEALGKELKCHCCHEGTGQVVGEATVKDIHEDLHHIINGDGNMILMNRNDAMKYCNMGNLDEMKLMGYNNHNYAIELDNIIKYDEEWLKNKRPFTGILTDDDMKLFNAPTEPIDKSEFVLWNKAVNFKKEVEDGGEKICGYCVCTDFGDSPVNTGPHNMCEGEGCETASQNYLDDEANVKSPPQGKVYVVERD